MTCEHASNDVPPELRRVFRGHAALRRTHRGWDPGSLPLAEWMAAGLAAPLFVGRWSRLVVDLNRSASSRAVFSEVTRSLPAAERRRLIEAYHEPYREAVAGLIGGLVERSETVLHVSVHTFTPVLDGKARAMELSWLFDPARPCEAELCAAWRDRMHGLRPELHLAMNQPYRGTADGLTTHLRRALGTERYAGVELELRQDLATAARARDRVAIALVEAVSRFSGRSRAASSSAVCRLDRPVSRGS